MPYGPPSSARRRLVYLKRIVDPDDPDPANPTSYVDVPVIVGAVLGDTGNSTSYWRSHDSTADNSARTTRQVEIRHQSQDGSGNITADSGTTPLVVERVDKFRVRNYDQKEIPTLHSPSSDEGVFGATGNSPGESAGSSAGNAMGGPDPGKWLTHVVRYNGGNTPDAGDTPWIDVELMDICKLRGYFVQRDRYTGFDRNQHSDYTQMTYLWLKNDPGVGPEGGFSDPDDPFNPTWSDINYWYHVGNGEIQPGDPWPGDGNTDGLLPYLPNDGSNGLGSSGDGGAVRLDPFQNIVNYQFGGKSLIITTTLQIADTLSGHTQAPAWIVNEKGAVIATFPNEAGVPIGNLIDGAGDPLVTIFDPFSGDELATRYIKNNPVYTITPVSDGLCFDVSGRLYRGYGSSILRVNSKTGSLLYTYPSFSDNILSAFAARGTVLILRQSYLTKMTVAETPELLWELYLTDIDSGFPIAVKMDSHGDVWVGFQSTQPNSAQSNSTLRKLSSKTGELLVTVNIPGTDTTNHILDTNGPIGSFFDTHVYNPALASFDIAGRDTLVVGLLPATHFHQIGGQSVHGGPIFPSYQTWSPNRVSCYDKNGNLNWTTNLVPSENSAYLANTNNSPAVAATNKVVVVGLDMYVLEPPPASGPLPEKTFLIGMDVKTGATIWSYSGQNAGDGPIVGTLPMVVDGLSRCPRY
jgi:hypothetical protein